MNAIITTSIICLTIIIVVCIICYTNYKYHNNDKFEFINKQLEIIHNKINNSYISIDNKFNNINDNIVKIVGLIKNINKDNG